MEFFGYHGTSAAEKQLAKRYSVDVEFEYDITEIARADRLDDKVVDYERVYYDIADFFATTKLQLTETIAERLANLLFTRYLMTNTLRVKVRKHHPPFPGNIEWVEVETVRQKIS